MEKREGQLKNKGGRGEGKVKKKVAAALSKKNKKINKSRDKLLKIRKNDAYINTNKGRPGRK